jgi:hypothetical protein
VRNPAVEANSVARHHRTQGHRMAIYCAQNMLGRVHETRSGARRPEAERLNAWP